jgi:hypothetical protein
MILDKKLEGLLKTKKFFSLSQEEKAFVSAKMTAEEYQNFRLILCGSRNSLKKIRTAPSPHVKENLMAAMRAKKAKKQPLTVSWNAITSYRIPAWQAAASVVFLLCSKFLMKQQVVYVENEMAAPLMVDIDTVYETIYKTDTVFEKVPVFLTGKKNVNVKPSSLERDSNFAEKDANILLTNMETMGNEMNTVLNDISRNRLLADSTPIYKNQIHPASNSWLSSPPRGRTAGEDADLMKFLTEIN